MENDVSRVMTTMSVRATRSISKASEGQLKVYSRRCRGENQDESLSEHNAPVCSHFFEEGSALINKIIRPVDGLLQPPCVPKQKNKSKPPVSYKGVVGQESGEGGPMSSWACCF